jgi:hypothetical protein
MEIGERELRATTARAPQTVGTKNLLYNAACEQLASASGRSSALAPFFGAQSIQIPSVIYMGSIFVSYIYGNVKGSCV